MSSTRTVGWGWLAAAAAVAAITILLAVTQQGACYDAVAPGASSCTSGPLFGVPGTIVLVVLATAFVVFAIVRAFRPRGE